jgi:hypothetical protein
LAPETGSPKIDYLKIDYLKIDYLKIDYLKTGSPRTHRPQIGAVSSGRAADCAGRVVRPHPAPCRGARP